METNLKMSIKVKRITNYVLNAILSLPHNITAHF